MKKILVTGAGGVVGIHVIKYLLTEGKYEITALDLKSKPAMQRLKKYRRRVNIIFGDVCNKVLMDALVKGHDVVINLASVMPPFSDMKKGLSDAIDYEGCANIVRAIEENNPKCHLFFASTTSMYKDTVNPTVKSKIVLGEYDYFSASKLKAENLIKKKLKNYTIYRIPLVLSNPIKEKMVLHGKWKAEMDVITKEDAAYAFVKGIEYTKELNKKTFNLAMEETVIYKNLFKKLLSMSSVWFRIKFWLYRLFVVNNYYSPVCKDKNDLEEIIHYRNDSLSSYYRRMRSRTKKK